MIKMPRFEAYCLETGVKALVTETGQQLPPSSAVFRGGSTGSTEPFNFLK